MCWFTMIEDALLLLFTRLFTRGLADGFRSTRMCRTKDILGDPWGQIVHNVIKNKQTKQ